MAAVYDLPLTDEEVDILIHENGPMTLDQISQFTGVTREMTRVIIKKALRLMRKRITVRYGLDGPMVASWCHDISGSLSEDGEKHVTTKTKGGKLWV